MANIRDRIEAFAQQLILERLRAQHPMALHPDGVAQALGAAARTIAITDELWDSIQAEYDHTRASLHEPVKADAQAELPFPPTEV